MKTLYLVCLALAILSCKDTSDKSEDVTTNPESLNADAAEQLWMDKIADVDWMENDKPGHKIRVGKPTIQNGIATGEFQESYSGMLNVCKYESPSEGILNMQIIKTIRDGVAEKRTGEFIFKYNLLDNGNTLVLNHSDGRTLHYTRSQNSNPVKETAIESGSNNSKNQLWMDKIATDDWKNVMNHQIVRFGKPTQHGDIIKGEVEMHEESFTQVFKYERVPDGEIKCKLIRFKIKGDQDFTEENSSGKEFDFSFKTELLDDGNTLVLNHSNGNTYRYKH
ncbi:hypothetical protein [Moheibacter sediminis]|uniref:Uncharacterized protein n=1 Tax=Moheibacter sediminis TaxID=1434700 RepID=A0A1W2AQT1_9FLAO|nr:hypothetical protein [Moheibacter sediminis]SMC62882.1 hypothetical protein SAMN06296427_1054 [Moheibacter sediminis]